MLDVGWSELLVIVVVLIVVVGPKDLPRMLRQFGRTTAKMRAMAGDFRKQFDEALKEAELDDVRDLANQARSLDPRQTIRKHLSPLEKAGQDVKAGLDEAMKPKTDISAEPAAPVAHVAEPVKAGAAEKTASTPAKRAAKAGAGQKTKRGKTDGAAAPASASRKAKGANGDGAGRKTGSAAQPAAKPASGKTKAKAAATARKPRSTPASRKQDKPGSAT